MQYLRALRAAKEAVEKIYRKAYWGAFLLTAVACSTSAVVKGVVWERGYLPFPEGRIVDTLYGAVKLAVKANTALWEVEIDKAMIIRDSTGSLVILEKTEEGWKVVATTGSRGNYFYHRVGGEEAMRGEGYYVYPLKEVTVKSARR